MSSRFSEAFILNASGNSNDGVTANPAAPLDGVTTTVAASMTTAPIWTKDLDAFSIQFSTVTGDTLVGSLSLQASNDRSSEEQVGKPNVTLQNWQTISFWDVGAGAQATTKAVASGAQSIILAERGCTYRWVRLVFTFTSGTSHPKVSMQQKGWP